MAKLIRLLVEAKDADVALEYLKDFGDVNLWEKWRFDDDSVKKIFGIQDLPENWRLIIMVAKDSLPDFAKIKHVARKVEQLWAEGESIKSDPNAKKCGNRQIVRKASARLRARILSLE